MFTCAHDVARLKAVETELTASMKKLLRLRSGAKPRLLCHPPPLPFSQQQFVAHTANLTRSSSSSPERIKKSVAFSLERWDDVLHCSDPDLLMKAAADSGMRQRLSAQGQGHKADPVGPLTYLLAAQYEISRTNLPCGRTNAKNILFGYIQASATSEEGTATLHPLVLYMAGVFHIYCMYVSMYVCVSIVHYFVNARALLRWVSRG